MPPRNKPILIDSFKLFRRHPILLQRTKQLRHVSLRPFRPAPCRRARRPVPRPDAALPRRRAVRGRVSPAAPAERPLHPEARADAADRDSRTACCRRTQLRTLAHIGRKYDRGYGHFTTRQNIQFNWPQARGGARHPRRARRGRDARDPDLAATASATSRADHFAGVAGDESRRPAAVVPSSCGSGRRSIRSSRYLPRKFKIAVTGADQRSRGDPRPRHRRCSSCATTRGERRLPRRSSAAGSAARR